MERRFDLSDTPDERERWHYVSRVLMSRLAILMCEYPDSEYLQHIYRQVQCDAMLHDGRGEYKSHFQIG